MMPDYGSSGGVSSSCHVKNCLDMITDQNGVFLTIDSWRGKPRMIILIFFFAHWYLSLFFQTFFLHRYTSHKMFKMTPFWEKTFFLFTFIFQGSSFLHPAAYGIIGIIIRMLILQRTLTLLFILQTLSHLIWQLFPSIENLSMSLWKEKEQLPMCLGGMC